MPASSLKSMARRAGKSLKDAERYWNTAKRSAEDQGFIEGDDDFYRYVMGIVKRRLGLASLLTVKANSLLHVTAVDEIAREQQQKVGWLTFDPKSPTRDDQVANLFVEMAHSQRGAPERLMTKVQFANGGGVLNPIVEHVGDLTHRIGQHLQYLHLSRRDLVSTDNVLNKAEKTKRWLDRPYGFEREHRENLRSNARMNKVSLEEQTKKVNDALAKYADAHRKIIVYNEPQYLCREAAIWIGERKFETASRVLGMLLQIIKSKHWLDKALSYYKMPHITNMRSSGKVEPILARHRYKSINWPKAEIEVE